MKKRYIIAVFSALACLALLPIAQAAPAPETPDPGAVGGSLSTADGDHALFNVTTGAGNSAFGWFSLLSNTAGNLNTAVGAATLVLNIGDPAASDGIENTAVGTAALLFNTTGSDNTAVGAGALVNNAGGNENIAVGAFALNAHTTNSFNNAVGAFALLKDVSGSQNNVMGDDAMFDNVSGSFNTAIGDDALDNNVDGDSNVAIGDEAGINIVGDHNICIGANTTGSATDNNTIRIGDNLPSGGIGVIDAGVLANFIVIGNDLNTQGITIGQLIGFGNVSIANGLSTTTGAASCNIGGIVNQVPTAGSHTVVVGPDNKLADLTASSRRFKKDIAPIDKLSEGVLALKPVTFHYKNDNTNEPEFGLVAEDVAEVNPDWITRDSEGEIFGVRYEVIPILLLNEFLKEHKKVEEQQANIAELKSTVGVLTAQLKEQAAQIQKVSAQLEVNKPAPQVVANKP
jgi:Chaperone of endosialidase